ncbi:MAG: hypothetical protein AB1801_01580 [Chloroflexota bacterium]
MVAVDVGVAVMLDVGVTMLLGVGVTGGCAATGSDPGVTVTNIGAAGPGIAEA